ncbi:MAG: GDP-mannose 4,6-dehydratase [Anaerolineae bacterium]
MNVNLSNLERHYLITGGAGFIGSHLAEALLADGHMVTVIDNLSTGRMDNIAHLTGRSRFRFAIDTITNAMVMDRLVSECDAVFHLAAAVGVELIVTDPVNTIETNVLGSHSVLQAAARYRKKVLLVSTSEIYGKGVRVPFAEDDDRVLGPTTKSRWSYSDSKAVDEFLGLAYHKQLGLPVVIARLFNTVGPRQTGRYGMVIPRFVGQALAGEELTVYGDGQQSRCFCNVADVVEALKGLIAAPEAVGEVFNVGSTEEVTILELARRILAATGRDQDGVRFVPYAEAYEPGFEDMERRVPDINKIGATIGWQPTTPLDETLQQVIAYEKDLKTFQR